MYRVRLPAVADSIEAGGSIPPPSTEGLSSGRLVYVKEWGASLLEKRTNFMGSSKAGRTPGGA